MKKLQNRIAPRKSQHFVNFPEENLFKNEKGCNTGQCTPFINPAPYREERSKTDAPSLSSTS